MSITRVNFQLPKKGLNAVTLPDEGGCSFLFLGSTRSGKTTMIKEIFDRFFSNHITVMHTCSPQAKIYDHFMKKTALAPSFCNEIIEETMTINQHCTNKYEFLHIIDDCVSSKNDKTMVKMLTIGRNSNLSCIISGQELSILNAIGRSNINFVFLGKLNSSMAVEKAIKSYLLGVFPVDMRIQEKIQLYNELTKDHTWIVLDAIENKAFLTRLDLSKL